jgi:ankyrin repeat protein
MHGPPKETHRALHAATAFGDTEIVRVLVENGANAFGNNKHGHTPLYMASRRGHEETVRLLVKMAGGDARAQDDVCWTHTITLGC